MKNESETDIAPKYAKVTFAADENGKKQPQLQILESDGLWDKEKGGFDRDNPPILINPGHGPANVRQYERELEDPSFLEEKRKVGAESKKWMPYEAKLIEKAIDKTYGDDSPESKDASREYLVAINRTQEDANLDIMRANNDSPNTKRTDYTDQQAKDIFEPFLVNEEGEVRSDDEIKDSFSQLKQFNISFGTINTNMQMNWLSERMDELGIDSDVQKDTIKSMRSVDAPNIASTPTKGNRPTSAIFHLTKDKMASEPGQDNYVNPKMMTNGGIPLPDGHNQTIEKVGNDSDSQVIYQTTPESTVPIGNVDIEIYQRDYEKEKLGLSPAGEGKSVPKAFEEDDRHFSPYLNRPAPSKMEETRDSNVFNETLATMVVEKDWKPEAAFEKSNAALKEQQREYSAHNVEVGKGQLERLGLQDTIAGVATSSPTSKTQGKSESDRLSQRAMQDVLRSDEFSGIKDKISSSLSESKSEKSYTEKSVDMKMTSEKGSREI